MPRYFITLLNSAIVVLSAVLIATPAAAVDGVVLITQANALAGNVTPGDAAGFPVTISAGGSYRLATNLQVPANKDGIVVNGTEVSIDLNGFRMNGAGVAAIGIRGNQRSLTVRNGTIRAFHFDGIYTLGALLVVEDMRISENGRNGIVNLTNGSARIVNNTIFGNAGYGGIYCEKPCHVEGNIISSNGGNGIIFGASGTALGNTVISNVGYGIYAFGKVGFGNNTMIDNGFQVGGALIRLFPNACSPVAC